MKLSRDDNVKQLVVEFQNGKFSKCEKEAISLLEHYKDDYFLYNFLGLCQYKLKKFSQSINTYKSAIKIKKDYPEALNNLGSSLIEIGKLEEAKECFVKAINIKPDYLVSLNNLAGTYYDLAEYDSALNSYNNVLKINPKFPEVEDNILRILTFFDPKNSNLNNITKANFLLKNVKLKINLDEKIENNELFNFYKKCNLILKENYKIDNFKLSQAWRRNKIDLNCKRHFQVFWGTNAIPKYCFECYKLQFTLKTVTDLIKLYFLFDNINLKNNNIRKCFVEMRSIAKGVYKGLIYCKGIEEAQEIKKIIEPKVISFFNNKVIIKFKRGCTEFGEAHPNFKEINKQSINFMNYPEEWQKKESLIDKNIPSKNRLNSKILTDSLNGININDFLTIKNWIIYAKLIGDNSYTNFDADIEISEFMKKEMQDQIENKNYEFKVINN